MCGKEVAFLQAFSGTNITSLSVENSKNLLKESTGTHSASLKYTVSIAKLTMYLKNFTENCKENLDQKYSMNKADILPFRKAFLSHQLS